MHPTHAPSFPTFYLPLSLLPPHCSVRGRTYTSRGTRDIQFTAEHCVPPNISSPPPPNPSDTKRLTNKQHSMGTPIIAQFALPRDLSSCQLALSTPLPLSSQRRRPTWEERGGEKEHWEGGGGGGNFSSGVHDKKERRKKKRERDRESKRAREER